MNNFWKENQKDKGFTLVELLVAIAVFSIVMLAATGIFVKIMNVQKKALAIQEVQDNISYTMEMISKEIRMMSEITTKNTASSAFMFKNSKDQDIIYSLDSGQLQRSIDGSANQAITSSDVTVSDLTFYINNWDIINGPQPRVTVNMMMEISDSNFGKAQARLQTTLSGRIYEN